MDTVEGDGEGSASHGETAAVGAVGCGKLADGVVCGVDNPDVGTVEGNCARAAAPAIERLFADTFGKK